MNNSDRNWKPATTETPQGCEFDLGDTVTFTNDYGVSFEGNKVIGFNNSDCSLWKYGNRVHLDNDCFWFPVKPDSLTLEKKAIKQ